MTTAPAADNLAPSLAPSRTGVRTGAYCAMLGVLAGVLMFWELGADALTGDEAQYALVVQNIKRSGIWLYVTPYPPTPYLQKPPLYFWLTAATYDLFGPTELAYRAWSAGAGVGAVVLTCVLGALLFTPEIGALAGLLLMTNRAFLLVHGARSGTFDALVTVLIVAGVVFYAMTLRGRFRWGAWVCIGTVAGLASLTKPFIGVPLVAFLAIHSLFLDRSKALRFRLAGPLIALACLLLVATPWYVAQWSKYPGFFHEMLQRNLYARAIEGVDDKHVEDWDYYAEQLSKSSIPFLLSLPAILYAAYASVKGPQRQRFTLLTLVGGGWIVLFSLSASKAVHYIYPAFPCVAVMLVAGVARVAAEASRRWTGNVRARRAVVAGMVLLAAFSFQYARLLFQSIPADRSPYVPWEMYKTLAPAVARDEAQVIFYGFPDSQIDWRSQLGLRARDCYYFEQMRTGARWTREWGELANELHPQKPSLLILARTTNLREMLPKTNLAQRTDARFIYPHQAYLLLGVDLQPLLSPCTTAEGGSRYLRVNIDDVASGVVGLELVQPLIAPARVSVRLRVAPGASRRIRYSFTLDKADGDFKTLENTTAFLSTDDVVDVSAFIETGHWAGPSTHGLTLTVHSDPSDQPRPTILGVEDARLTMLPVIPHEPHPNR